MKMPIKPVRYEKILFEKVAKYPHSEKIESLKGPKTPTKMTKKKKEPKKQITKPKLPPKLNIDLKPKKSFKPPKMEKTEDLSEEDLGIASVPMKKPIKIDIDQRKLDELAKKETEKTKFILIECPICGQPPIVMPVPKKIIKNSEEPVVDISYVHGDPQHVIVAQLDHDYQVRRRRASWVVFEEKN